MKKKLEYNIGLDIGTNSVGWAVINNQYDLLNFKKKNLWGVRLFEGAESAADRRVNRSTRRRYRRRRNRINWLNEIFSAELSQVDPSFLTRMNSSWISKEDSTRKRDRYNLFDDPNFNDKDYYAKYKTIYHLRKALMFEDQKFDIRLIYLAIHNILKYRGNFTYEYRKFSVSEINNDLSKSLVNFNHELASIENDFPENMDLSKVTNSLLTDEKPSSKIDQIIAYLDLSTSQKKYLKEVLKLILGNSANLNLIMHASLEKEVEKLSLSAKDIDLKLNNLENLLDDEQIQLIYDANKLYSAISLHDILGKNTYISLAKIDQYDAHHDDLKKLKEMWYQTDNPSKIKKSRQAYKDYISGSLGIEDFYKAMKPFLEIAQPVNYSKEALQKIDSNNYLPKQRSSENSVIPFQLNKMELEKILDNQSKYYPFLKENKDKIISIMSFRIPYYVGPLEDGDKNFSWMERKVQQKIRPWNFDEVVDREASSNKFIKRMTATDSYLIGESVLPKYSLIYQKYEVLSELNNLRISEDSKSDPKGEKIPLTVKQQIFTELFSKYKAVKSKQLKNWLIKNSYYTNPSIIGLADPSQFNSSLSTFIDMKNIFGQEFVENPDNLHQLEELVEWLTVFEDKQILSSKLKSSNYSYTDKQINQISNMRYQGWGRLSKKLLCDIKVETTTYQSLQLTAHSILDLLWSTKNNFVSILHDDKYGFEKIIDDYNFDKNDVSDIHELVSDIHTSPALKRGIIQSLNIVKELVHFMGHAPKHIFLEFTREDQASNLTESRKKRINKLYNLLTKDTKQIKAGLRTYLIPGKNIKDELKKHDKDLSSERLMLYFLQNGKSLYSDAPLDIERLSEYQVDHILPRTYIKDDSLENKALVLASENQRKSSDLLLDSAIIDKNWERWNSMKDVGLMGPKKFKNLTRREITDDDQRNFINRQLVQTSQITKSVANILTNIYKDQGTICLQSRANLSSDFRAAFSEQDHNYHFKHPEFVKNRDINDFHHAQDAYLACFLGLYRLRRFPSDEALLINNEYKKFFNQVQKSLTEHGKVPDSQKNGFILAPLVNGKKIVDGKTGEIIWDINCKKQVIRIFNYKQYNVTKRTEIKTGEFYNQTLYSPNHPKIKKLIPRKNNLDPHIYGGYSSDKPAYLVIYRVDNKKMGITSIPIRISKKFKENGDTLQSWLETNIKHKKTIEIIKTKIPIGQLVHSSDDGYLTMQSEKEVANAQQLVLSPNYVALLTLLHASESEYEQILSFYDDDILLNIFDEIINKMPIFYPFFEYELKYLTSIREDFQQTNIIEQVGVIQQLLIMLHANSSNANLKFGKIKKTRLGRKSSGLKMTNIDLIYQSVTGLYQTNLHIE